MKNNDAIHNANPTEHIQFMCSQHTRIGNCLILTLQSGRQITVNIKHHVRDTKYPAFGIIPQEWTSLCHNEKGELLTILASPGTVPRLQGIENSTEHIYIALQRPDVQYPTRLEEVD